MVSKEFQNINKSIQEEVTELKLKDQAATRLLKAGIPKVKQPKAENYLEFPEDVSEIPSKDLGKYLGIYESEAGWVSYCIARREIDLAHAKVLLVFVYNTLLSNRVDKPTERKMKVEADDFYLGCKMEVTDMEADISLLKASRDNLERYAKAVSREMTNRKTTIECFPGDRGVYGPIENKGAFGGDND